MASTTTGTAGELFKAGRLTAAIEAATAAVKAAPTDVGARVLLAEMLLFSGNLERADVILDAAGMADPSASMVMAEFRQLLRADMARRQLFRDGRVPEFLGEPGPSETASLAALVALRAGDMKEAAAKAEEAESHRAPTPGEHNAAAFDDFRDASDLFSGFLEVLTTTGKYYWVPTARIEQIEFHAPKRPRDLAWRRASMAVADGPDGDVYIPALYAPLPGEAEPDEAHRLGRETSWTEDGAGPVRGTGQRVFLVGEEALSIMELGALGFGA